MGPSEYVPPILIAARQLFAVWLNASVEVSLGRSGGSLSGGSGSGGSCDGAARFDIEAGLGDAAVTFSATVACNIKSIASNFVLKNGVAVIRSLYRYMKL